MLHTARGLAERGELLVIGPSGCRGHLPANVHCVELSPHPALFLPLAILHGLRLCLSARPGLVLGGSGLLGPVLLLLQWLRPVRTAVYLHGLDIVAQHWLYRALFVPTFRRLHGVITNSHNTAALAEAAGVSSSRIAVVHPGTELPDLNRTAAAERFRERHAIGARRLLLFVGRVTPRKGLRRFVEACFPAVLEAEPDSCLIVIGDRPAQGLAGHGSELQAVLDFAARHELGDALRFLGQVDDVELQEAYAAADVLVFPLVPTPGDVEGFGMVAIEAAAAGTPTVAFAVGGVVDAVAEGYSGYLVEPDDYAGYADAVLECLGKPGALEASSRDFAAGFSWPRYHEELERVLEAAALKESR